MRGLFWVCAISIAMLNSPWVYASSKTPGKVIAGWVEKVGFGDEGAIIKAKLDTGAKTSSIHAENIEKFKKDDDHWVRFTLMLEDKKGKLHEIAMEAPRSRRVKIKNHDGDHERRVVVDLDFCFDGRQHTAEFTLANRSEYIYSVLLGREFLKGVAVVDPDATFLTKAACP